MNRILDGRERGFLALRQLRLILRDAGENIAQDQMTKIPCCRSLGHKTRQIAGRIGPQVDHESKASRRLEPCIELSGRDRSRDDQHFGLRQSGLLGQRMHLVLAFELSTELPARFDRVAGMDVNLIPVFGDPRQDLVHQLAGADAVNVLNTQTANFAADDAAVRLAAEINEMILADALGVLEEGLEVTLEVRARRGQRRGRLISRHRVFELTVNFGFADQRRMQAADDFQQETITLIAAHDFIRGAKTGAQLLDVRLITIGHEDGNLAEAGLPEKPIFRGLAARELLSRKRESRRSLTA